MTWIDMKWLAAIALTTALPGAAAAQHAGSHSASPYSEQERRAVKSMSDEDMAELSRGGGWGLAKAAELNGVPGPAHLLELKNRIPLSAEQTAVIGAIFDTMKTEAVSEGLRLIERELALETAFRERTVTDASLRRMLSEIEESRAKLRYIHLATHLSTPALLSEQQIARYNALRGYGTDPCASVPDGHDPAMWRRHNGCK